MREPPRQPGRGLRVADLLPYTPSSVSVVSYVNVYLVSLDTCAYDYQIQFVIVSCHVDSARCAYLRHLPLSRSDGATGIDASNTP